MTLVFYGQSPTAPRGNLEEVRRAILHSKDLESQDSILKTKKLNGAERRRLFDYLLREWKSPDMGSEAELRAEVSNARVELADLDGDGVNEVIVQGSGDRDCSPTGNCSLEVLRRSGEGFEKIAGAIAQDFSITGRRTGAFSDLVLGMHGSATSSEVRLFRYRDGRYRRAACYVVNWQPDPDKPQLTEPAMSPCR